MDRLLAATIIPEGQDAELMGFYLFADISLSWLPPIIFTALNEAGLSERVGLASICVFFFLSLIGYWKMGSYEDCVKAANRLLVVPPAEPLVVISEDSESPVAHTRILSTGEVREAEATEQPVDTQ